MLCISLTVVIDSWESQKQTRFSKARLFIINKRHCIAVNLFSQRAFGGHQRLDSVLGRVGNRRKKVAFLCDRDEWPFNCLWLCHSWRSHAKQRSPAQQPRSRCHVCCSPRQFPQQLCKRACDSRLRLICTSNPSSGTRESSTIDYCILVHTCTAFQFSRNKTHRSDPSWNNRFPRKISQQPR